MKICGIDEARRGPVIGPMVISGVLIDDDKSIELKKIGVKDSKLLTSNQREALFPKIKKLVDGYKVIIISAQEMDSRASVGLNINQLEALKAAEIIKDLKPDVAYVDSPTSPRASKFAEMIRANLPKEFHVDIIAEHKADVNHVEVGAASILSKVTGDEEVEKIRKEIGLDFGSGYPADPITMGFVKEHWENKLAKYIRHSWGTIKELEKLKGQKKLEGFD
ncbi:MAG TPA: ribonuclease HII [Nanoarchaeota archaeon]|nr:ribonuclease HII [Nanoarchaeota archaeon]